MSGSEARLNAVSAIINSENYESGFDYKKTHSSELFGKNVFSKKAMQERLAKPIFKSLMKTIETGGKLDIELADAVASAMQSWAIEKGATHYTHVFYPLTGSTAEKHDSFFAPDGDGNTIAGFSGSSLIQAEPDASSFPSGGIRQTFEARGYTAWDVTSPAYIMENPNGSFLCIPSAFISWTGEALDKKTPLLRSMQALNVQSQRILKLFGHEDPGFIASTAGCEQEYFLVDSNFAYARPDLLSAGRTVFGAAAPKGQEFDDHYFGHVPERVMAYMMEVERELFKLGIPAVTRHNEVAPGQFEIAPMFETANVATDHQHLIMHTLKRIAKKHGMTCLLHEKPFAGVNGSGKHVNWALGCPGAGNLLDPGSTPHSNAQFLVFCGAVIRAVHKFAPLLRAVVASAANDHRLGANEAPPAIISVFLGDQLNDVMEQIKKGKVTGSKKPGTMNIGVDTLPPLPKDAGDRNRTSPFAFIGNRFEFRAVGSSASVAGPLVAMNTIIADSLDYIATELEKAMKTAPSEKKLNTAVQKVLKSIMQEHGAVIFNGDGYSDEWHAEAEKRGLPNLKTTVDALPYLTDSEVVKIFKKHGVLNKRELASREEVYFEQYAMTINVESNLVLEMGRTQIFPAAIRYQSELAKVCADLKAVGYEFDTDTLDVVTALVKSLQDSLSTLEEVKEKEFKTVEKEAVYAKEAIVPAMLAVREAADALEGYVADDLWPLPTFQEMLFVK